MENTNLITLENQKNEYFTELEGIEEKMNTFISDFLSSASINDTKIKTHITFRDITFILMNNELQWTDSFRFTLSNNKNLVFSHGSGGYRDDIAVEKQMAFLNDIQQVGAFLKDNIDTFVDFHKSCSIVERNLFKTSDKIKQLKADIALENTKKQLLETGFVIYPFEEAFEDIKSNDKIYFTIINSKSSVEMSIENKGDNKLNLYLNGNKIAKKDFQLFFEDNEVFVKKAS